MTRTVRDDLGAAVTVADAPRRLVSLVPNLSEVLAVLGLADRVVGVTDWCVAPPDAFPDTVRVRGTKNPDVAAVQALEPDLVVANEEENRELDVRRLREAGVTVYVTRVRTVVEAAASLGRLGEIVGAPQQAAALRATMLEALADPPRGGPPVRAFCPVWRDPWMATGAATYAGDLLAHAGFALVPGDPDARYPVVDLDEVAAADPDVVLLPDEPYPFGPDDHPAFAGWPASVAAIDGAALTWWGPRTPAALAALRRLAGRLRRAR